MRRAERKLYIFIVLKSAVEILFVVALAAGFHYRTFNPRFRGNIDVADAKMVAGWVVDEAHPARQVEVQLYLNGHFIASRVAEDVRNDLIAARRTEDARHGFTFLLPPLVAGEYEARVYAVHQSMSESRRTLLVLPYPKRFSVAGESAAEKEKERR